MIKLWGVIIAAALTLPPTIASARHGGGQGQDRVEICHAGHDPVRDRAHIIEVSVRGAEAHLRHGDHLVGPEVCDGIDNDCDGVTDEGIDPVPSACGVGQCAAEGQITCVDGELVDDCEPGEPAPEICDGLDNDCDGAGDPPFCEEGEFGCIAFNECLNQCAAVGGDPACFDHCVENTTPAGLFRHQAIFACADANGCLPLPPEEQGACLEEFCADELNACIEDDRGFPPPPPPPPPPADCGAALDCAVGCAGDLACIETCAAALDPEQRALADAVLGCALGSGCNLADPACIQQACGPQIDACFGGGEPPPPPPPPECIEECENFASDVFSACLEGAIPGVPPEPIACDTFVFEEVFLPCAQSCEEEPPPPPPPPPGSQCVDVLNCAIGCADDPFCIEECVAAADPDQQALAIPVLECAAASGCGIENVPCVIENCADVLDPCLGG